MAHGKRPAPVARPRSLEERGRIMYAEDIQELLGKRPNGLYRRSRAWIQANFAPEYRCKSGRLVFWWQADVERWLEGQREYDLR